MNVLGNENEVVTRTGTGSVWNVMTLAAAIAVGNVTETGNGQGIETRRENALVPP